LDELRAISKIVVSRYRSLWFGILCTVTGDVLLVMGTIRGVIQHPCPWRCGAIYSQVWERFGRCNRFISWRGAMGCPTDNAVRNDSENYEWGTEAFVGRLRHVERQALLALGGVTFHPAGEYLLVEGDRSRFVLVLHGGRCRVGSGQGPQRVSCRYRNPARVVRQRDGNVRSDVRLPASRAGWRRCHRAGQDRVLPRRGETGQPAGLCNGGQQGNAEP
jgi:hypothetical protein